MSQTDNPWLFLGYDLRDGLGYIQAGWREFFEGPGQAFGKIVAEPVRLYSAPDRSVVLQAGQQVNTDKAVHQGVLLAPEQLLTRHLTLPASSESDLAAVLELEVQASSPFLSDETRYGWVIVNRTGRTLQVLLVITCAALAEERLQQLDWSVPDAQTELWAQIDDTYVPLQSAATTQRHQREQRALKKQLIILALIAVLLASLPVIPALGKFFEMRKVRDFYTQAQSEAQSALAVRATLNNQQQLLADSQVLEGHYHPPLAELAQLTELIPDDAFIISAGLSGNVIQLNGLANNATGLIQTLSQASRYAKVEPSAAITSDINSGKERFSLQITLAKKG